MTGWTFAMVAATVLFDVVGQTLFKLGLHRTAAPAQGGSGIAGFWAGVLCEPRILAGIAIYAAEFLVWFAVLARVDLSVAVPLASFSYCGVLLASRLLLGETVPLQRWLGAALVTAGVTVILLSSPV